VTEAWDAIVVGGRCAGSPTAMLLARRGYRVLLVDSAQFPSDTLSTHQLHPPGVEALERWGVLERLVATRCPAISKYTFDFGPFALSGSPGTAVMPFAYGPRRTVLDQLLLDAASQAGVEVRQGFTVDDLTTEAGRVTGIRGHAGGKQVTESARVVIGADGRHSLVAKQVQPAQYHERPKVQVSYYAYFSDLPTDGFETYMRDYVGWAAIPTHEGLTVLIVARPIADFDAIRQNIEGRYFEAFRIVPAFAERVRRAKRQSQFFGASVEGYFRKPFGAGWALVGDAGYNKDFIPAMGISDAFRDAELCAQALDSAFSGAKSFDDALLIYQQTRDEHSLPMYEFTYQIAPLAPPPRAFQELLHAVHSDPRETARFIHMTSGVLSPAVFFSQQSVQGILAGAGARAS
jgi:2-polyprenyl-6-methoxyphenol hydroxylase-like FAD-dependent oxidoreductase